MPRLVNFQREAHFLNRSIPIKTVGFGLFEKDVLLWFVRGECSGLLCREVFFLEVEEADRLQARFPQEKKRIRGKLYTD